MEKPIKIALLGISVSVVVALGGYLAFQYSKIKISDLVINCQSESKLDSVAVEMWRSENHISGLARMGTVDDYAEWIVANKERKGSAEFEDVARAYILLRDGPRVCDPLILQNSLDESKFNSVQAQIVGVMRDGMQWKGNSLIFASAIALFSIIPYFWYFILRRIREVRDAVVGK